MTVRQREDELDAQFEMAVALDEDVSERINPDAQGIAAASRSGQGVLDGDVHPDRSETFSESEKRQTELTKRQVQAALGQMNKDDKAFLRELVAQAPREAEVFVEVFHYFPGVHLDDTA